MSIEAFFSIRKVACWPEVMPTKTHKLRCDCGKCGCKRSTAFCRPTLLGGTFLSAYSEHLDDILIVCGNEVVVAAGYSDVLMRAHGVLAPLRYIACSACRAGCDR